MLRYTCQVTLHVRVWIEISGDAVAIQAAEVTLHVRVWIEMPVSPLLPLGP